ncbi:MAG: ABC transporter permease subunit, partial [Planctomycetaceae bacterium]
MIGSPQDKPVPLPSRAVTGDGLVGSFVEAESSGGRLWGWGTGLAWAVSLLAMMVTAIILWLAGRPIAGIAVAGFAGLVVGLWFGVAVLRRTLSGSSPIIGVARAIVEEAISTRLSMVPLLLVLVSLPILPLLLDSTERLAYRIQFFLTWSLSIASVLLSVITIAVAASSVSGDIETSRIHMALAKPVRRWEYLFGKWLGVVLLDVLLVTLVGVGVYCFALSLARTQAVDVEDRIAVDEQVLTARASSRPEHPGGDEFDRSVEATIAEIRRDDPAAFDRNPKRARKRILSQRVHEWHTVTADVVSSFMFKGLGPENVRSSIIQLRMEPFADNSSIARADVRFAIWLNERPYPVHDGVHKDYTFGTGTIHTIDIPAEAIADDGTLRLTIANRNLVMSGEDRPTSISFEPGEGLELLYRVDSFGSNVIRALLVLWAKLAMLAAAAIAAAAWLGFPTALLTGLM